MQALLVDVTVGLVLLNLVVAIALGITRLLAARENARMAAIEERLRPTVLALVDGEGLDLAPSDDRTTLVLSDLLRRYARLLTGSARSHIAAVAAASGLVAREVAALGDRRSWRRATAAMILGDLGDASVAPRLLKALNDRSPDVRNAAARSLGRLGAVEGIPRIARQMALGRIPRALAAETLMSIGPAAAEWLVRLLRAKESGVRAGAAELLGLVGDAGDVPALTAALSDPDPEVRVKAARSLGRIGVAAATDEIAGALDDPVAYVRGAAARTLGLIGDRRTLDRLTAMAIEDDHDPARSAAHALGEIDLDRLEHETERHPDAPYLAEALDLARLR